MGLPIVDDDVMSGRSASRSVKGRRPRYALRVSVLEQCQLDCRYCRPGAVTSPTEAARWLSAAEHARLAALFFARGVEKVRFTGGEPTLRKDLVDVVAAWSAARPAGVKLALTTNALRLAPLLPALKDAGLDGVTVHLDTLKPERVVGLMGDGADVDVVWSAVDVALSLGFSLKWNVVVQKGRNDDELAAVLAVSRQRGVEVRFIELMNTGSARGYVKEVFLSGRDVVDAIGARSLPRRHQSDPAALFASNDGVVFGVIASDTEPFCSDCDRLRLSADGRLRGCLYQPGGLPLGGALRAGASDEALLTLLDAGLDDKRSHHPLVQAPRQPFSMADVGG
jgi:cyclic pyranopterin phosphate synthase